MTDQEILTRFVFITNRMKTLSNAMSLTSVNNSALANMLLEMIQLTQELRELHVTSRT